MAKGAFRLEVIRTGDGAPVLLRCAGPLTAGHGGEHRVWASLLDRLDCADLILDLSGVTQLDAAGIGRLAELRGALHRRGGSLRLIEASRRVKTMLSVTGVADVLDRPATAHRTTSSRCRAARPTAPAVTPPAAAAV